MANRSVMNQKLKLGVGVVMVLLFVTIYNYYSDSIKEFWAIDSCLDAGGAWDYTKQACDESDADSCFDAGGIWDEINNQCRF